LLWVIAIYLLPLSPSQRASGSICGKSSSVVFLSVLRGLGFGFQFSLFGNFGNFGNLPAQLHHLNPLRAFRPVMYPAHNYVALFRIVPVPQKVPALKHHFHISGPATGLWPFLLLPHNPETPPASALRQKPSTSKDFDARIASRSENSSADHASSGSSLVKAPGFLWLDERDFPELTPARAPALSSNCARRYS
jgi:hypothetical protein